MNEHKPVHLNLHGLLGREWSDDLVAVLCDLIKNCKASLLSLVICVLHPEC